LLLRGKVVETWRGMKGFAGSFGNGSAAHWALPLAQIARAMLAPAGIRPALRRMRQLWNPLHQPSWYSAQFCERATERALRQNSELLLGGSYHSQYLRSMATTAYYRINLEVLGKISGSLGLQTTYPFFDRDLIQLVMSIPGETLNFRHQPRALFREALRGIVPDEVRLRRGKANFSSFLVSSVDQDLAAIEALLKNESIAADLGYVRMDNLRAEVALLRERWRCGDTATLPRLGGLLGLELWLRTFIAGEKSRLPAPTEAATA
jgi:asparagine synthase (glutamine-hydrolysing)